MNFAIFLNIIRRVPMKNRSGFNISFKKYLFINNNFEQSFNAFTLIELLVVISIIILLSGLIFSVMSRAKEKALQTVCASNLRQLGMAAIMYSQDFDDAFPPYVNAYPGSDCNVSLPGNDNIVTSNIVCSPLNLHSALMPFIENSNIWFCPNDPFATQHITQWKVDHQYSSYNFSFCAQIGSLFTILKNDGSQWQISTGRIIPLPSNLSISQFHLIQDPHSSDRTNPCGIFNTEDTNGGNHFNGVNVCYLDDHVKWISLCQ